MKSQLLETLIDELQSRHNCHSIILYGSRAHGTETSTSDVDIVCFRAETEAISDSRLWNDYWLDVWIYPDQDIKIENFLQLDGGKVLLEKESFATQLLEAIHSLAQQAPDPLPEHELRQRRNWFLKTIERIQKEDPEAWYRRYCLQVDLLEHYFLFRQRRFMGFKRSMQWLSEHDSKTYQLMQKVYSSECDIITLKTCLERVLIT